MILIRLRIILMFSKAARHALLAAGLCAAALLSGCGALTGASDTDPRAAVASFYPLAWVTEQVAGDDWTVTNLTTPGGEPHDLELSIGATADLTEADLVVYLEGFQPAVDDGIATAAEGTVLDAADHVRLREGDPHFWLDPMLMVGLTVSVADALAALDPDGAAAYRARADELVAELEDLDQQYVEGLADCQRDVVVVSHDAFGYLARYGMQFEPIAGLSPDAEPTPATLASLADLIEFDGVITVFSERLASPAMAETLAADLGVGTAVLDPFEGLIDQTAGQDYLSLMRDNLAALEKANGC